MRDDEGSAEADAPFDSFQARQVEEVLAHPEVKALVAGFPERREQLRNCIEGLISEGPAETEILVQATKKAFGAITNKLRIFLSYKRAQHADVAQMLRSSLQALGGGKIKVFLDEVNIGSGQEWFKSIKNSLRNANCLVLLVPDDSDEREWPIFEAGFFAGRMLPGERLICLHHPAVRIPRQLAAFQGHKADAAGIEELFRRLLVKSDIIPGLNAINPDSEPFLEEHARKLAEKFSGPIRLKPRATMNFVTLELSTPGQFKDQQDLLCSKVIAGRGLDDMFRYTGGIPCELQEALHIKDGKTGRYDVWLAELSDCIREESAHRRAEMPFAKFSTHDGKQFFRPVLRQIEEDEKGAAHKLEIVFGEHLIGINDDPDDLQIIEAALRLAARIRGEILSRLSNPWRIEHVERIERVLKRIEREAQDEGFRDRNMLTRLFKSPDREIIERLYSEWEHYRNDQGTGKLDEAFATKDYVLLREALKKVKEMNLEFTIVAVRQYAEMLTNNGCASI